MICLSRVYVPYGTIRRAANVHIITHREFLTDLIDRLSHLKKDMEENLQKAKESSKLYYDKRMKPLILDPGMEPLILNPMFMYFTKQLEQVVKN